MTTPKIKVPETLWYEDKDGNVIPHVPGETPFSDKELYQHTRSVAMRHNVLGQVRQADVDACSHDETRATGGWIDGVEGRECCGCKGTQVRHLPEPWPEKWEGGSCYNVVTMNSGWDSNVVNAMVRSGDYGAKDAALISATCCERCWNVLLYHYHVQREEVGDDHGYPIGSDEEMMCGTSCILCDEVTEVCSEERVSCCGTHTFLISTDGKHWMCDECGVPGVQLTQEQRDKHVELGGEPLSDVVSETFFKYKVRGRTDKYLPSGIYVEEQQSSDRACDGGPPSAPTDSN